MSENDNMTAMSHETTGFCFCGQMHGQVKDWNEHDWAALRTHAPAGSLSGNGQPTVELEAYLNPADELLDQGITRLQLLAFLRGEEDPNWNGGGHKWVRYRMHSVRRFDTLDGLSILLTYTEHDGAARDATWTVRLDLPDVDYSVAAVLRNIDTIIDAAIAHHGPDGVA